MTLAEHYLTKVLDLPATPENIHRLVNEHCPDFHYKVEGYRPCPKTKSPGYSCSHCWNEKLTTHTVRDVHHYL